MIVEQVDLIHQLGLIVGTSRCIDYREQGAPANIYRDARAITGCVMPADIASVQKIIEFANHYSMPLYPLSRGKNYGLGCRLPVEQNNLIVDLKDIDHIRDYNDEAGTVTIGAGVSQKQLADYLVHQGARYRLNVTGSSEDSSVVGNALERGVAHYGCRVNEVIAMQVILGNGDTLQCGGPGGLGEPSWNSYAYALGPDLKGLFFQSAFGIVVEITLKLTPIAGPVQVASIEKKTTVPLAQWVDTLADLRYRNLLPDNLHIANPARRMSVVAPLIARYEQKGIQDISQSDLDRFCQFSATSSLNLDARLVDSYKTVITETLAPVANVHFADAESIRASRDVITCATRGVFEHAQGIPSDDALYSLGYEQQQLLDPKDLSASNVGTFFLVPVIPFTGADVDTLITIVNQRFEPQGFTPFITFNFIEHFNLEVVINLTYSTDDMGRVEQAKSVMLDTFEALNRQGYLPQRLSVFQSPVFGGYHPQYLSAVTAIKRQFDPNGIIAPGKYGL
ncbi:FAD-binding oxidoreductase [Microbulbifer epialgicus]|uniref:FAD-dependent oxidoreductase n=1 Tax=Microbulbifer epialgicus TaxID=393907 RepID=A0ABV4P0P3_9GAMM